MSCSPTAWPITPNRAASFSSICCASSCPEVCCAPRAHRGDSSAAGACAVAVASRRSAPWSSTSCRSFVAVYHQFIPLTFSGNGFSALVRHGAMFACIATALPSLLFRVAEAGCVDEPIQHRRRLASSWRTVCVPWSSRSSLAPGCSHLRHGQPELLQPAVTMESLLAELPGRFLPIGFLHFSGLTSGPRPCSHPWCSRVSAWCSGWSCSS